MIIGLASASALAGSSLLDSMTDPMLSGEGKANGGQMTGSPQKSSFPVAILRARAPAAQKKQFAFFECCPVPRKVARCRAACAKPSLVAASALPVQAAVNHRLRGGWSCNLIWVASDACYEVAAFWAPKKNSRFTPPPSVTLVSPKTPRGPGPLWALIQPPPIYVVPLRTFTGQHRISHGQKEKDHGVQQRGTSSA